MTARFELHRDVDESGVSGPGIVDLDPREVTHLPEPQREAVWLE